jgi:hypothetical protein
MHMSLGGVRELVAMPDLCRAGIPSTSLTAGFAAVPRDGRSIDLYRTGEVPAKVCRLELTTGKKTVRKQIVPVDTTGVSTIGPIQVTPDGKTYVCGFHRTLGTLSEATLPSIA